MKVWLKSLAVLLVLGCGSSSSVYAEGSSTVEYLSPARQYFRAPVILQDRDESSSYDMPSAVSEYRSGTQSNKSPYVTEFGQSRSRPVSVQPPTVQPTAASPHIQEFGTLPARAFDPSFDSVPSFSQQKSFRLSKSVKRKTSHVLRPQAIAYKLPGAPSHSRLIPVHLIPLDQLAVYPAANARDVSVKQPAGP